MIGKRRELRRFIEQSSFLSENTIKKLPFASLGTNVSIARNATIVGFENISIGNNVRIDSNVVIIASAGYLKIGDFVHIGAHAYLACSGGVELCNFSAISCGVNIFTASDDFTGANLTNPMIPIELRKLKKGEIKLNEHVVIGSQTVILPEVEIGSSSSVGALSLINKSLEPGGIYFGIPVRKIGERSKNHLLLAEKLKNDYLDS